MQGNICHMVWVNDETLTSYRIFSYSIHVSSHPAQNTIRISLTSLSGCPNTWLFCSHWYSIFSYLEGITSFSEWAATNRSCLERRRKVPSSSSFGEFNYFILFISCSNTALPVWTNYYFWWIGRWLWRLWRRKSGLLSHHFNVEHLSDCTDSVLFGYPVIQLPYWVSPIFNGLI